MTTQSNDFYADFSTTPGITNVGARTFRFLGAEPGAELVLENVGFRLLVSEDMSLWEELKTLWAVLRGRRVHVTADVSILFDRTTAIQANDELIEALYYDEAGTYWNGAPPALQTTRDD